MHLHHHHLLYSFRRPLFIFLVIIFLHINLLSSSAQDDNEKYTNCNTPYVCGDITATFPFWGENRPDYCGHPSFELYCNYEDYSSTTYISIGSDKYRVTDINNETFYIARIYIHRGICPRDDDPYKTIITSSSGSYFDIASYNRDVGFYSNCTTLAALASGTYLNYSCSLDSGYGTDLYTFASEAARISAGCYTSAFVIPVSEEAIGELWRGNFSGQVSVRDALGSGLKVRWTLDGGGIGARCRSCRESGGECGYDSKMDNNFTCFCSDRQPNCLRNTRIITDDSPGATIGGVLTIFACSTLVLIFFLKKKISSDKTLDKKMEDFFKDFGSLAPKRFKYKDVKKMTNSFKEKLGQGGYGTVFKGQLHDGRLVAVKVLLSKSKINDGEDFVNEVASITRTCHVNIVTLLGFCFDGKKKALIYEFMANGSLEKFIYNRKQLSESGLMLGWETLYQIAIGIARGLEYLHRGCTTRILHFDIKPHNILLDVDFQPKISDFGLSRLCPGKESIISSILGARGTPGYIAPEVFNRNFGGVSHKSDVYSYGMMVLEMVGGRKNIDVKVGMDHSSQLYFPHWVHDRLKVKRCLGLHGIVTEEREEVARKMIIVGLWCIQTNQSHRPSMSKVLEMLEGSVEALPIPPKPFLSSPPGSP